MENETTQGSGLSPGEQSYFDSRGAQPSQERPEPRQEAQEPEGVEERPEGSEEGQERPREPRHVPLSELIRERKARQQEAQARQQLEQQFARADERLRVLYESQQRQQPQEPQRIPSPDEDIFGYSRAMGEQVARLNQMAERFQYDRHQEHQQRQAAQQFQGFVAHVAGLEQEYASKEPDYYDAVNHLRQTRAAELELMGIPKREHAQYLAQESLEIAQYAMRTGQNPPELALKMAKAKGWKPKAADAEERIERLSEAVPRAKSLSQAGGQTSSRAMDAKTLANMSDDDFRAFMDKNGGRGFRKVLNG